MNFNGTYAIIKVHDEKIGSYTIQKKCIVRVFSVIK